MSSAKRLERLERRLGVQDGDDDGYEDVPIERWIEGQRLLRELRGAAASPEERAGFEAAEARFAAAAPGATVRERRLRLSPGAERQLEELLATRRLPLPHASEQPEPDWLRPPAPPFDPGEGGRED
jgi:hypothetical protein